MTTKPLLLAACLALQPLSAGTYTWTGTSTGAWNTTAAANWSGVNPVFDNTAEVNFTGDPTIVTYGTWLGDGNRIVKTINCSGNFTSSLEIRTNNNSSTARTLTFSADTGNATLSVAGTVSQPIIVGAVAGTNDNGTIALASNLDIVHNGSALLTMRRPITGSNGIAKSGTGTLVLSAANTFSGDVTISGGILELGNAAALGATSGDTYVTSGGTLSMKNYDLSAGESVSIAGTGHGGIGALYQGTGNDSDANSIADGLILTGDATVGAASGVRYGIGGNGAPTTGLHTLTKTGTGQFDLRGPVTIGDIIVNEGSLQTQASTFNSGYNLTVNSGTTLRLFNIGSAFPRDIFLNNATIASSGTAGVTGDTLSGNLTLTGACTLNAGGDSDDLLILSGNISEAAAGASLTKGLTRNARLSGTNTYTGATTISAGTLEAVGSFTSDFSVAAAATLAGEGVTTGTVTFANSANLVFDNFTNGANQFFRAADVIIAGGEVVNVSPKNGPGGTGIVVLRDGNGGLDLANFNLIPPGGRGGVLALGGAGGNSDLIYNSNSANLEWRGFVDSNWITNDTDFNFQNTGTASPDTFIDYDNVSFVDTATGTITLGSNITAGNIVFANTTGNNVSIVPAAAETLTATGIATTAGGTSTISAPIVGSTPITVGGGTLILGAANTSNGAIVIDSGGTLQIGTGGSTGSLPNAPVTNNGAIKTNRSGSLTIGTNITGSGTFTHDGPGTTILTANNTYTGLTTVNNGILQIGNDDQTGRIDGDLLVNTQVDFWRQADMFYGKKISGTGKINKRGVNKLTLAGANDFSGGVDLTYGTLNAGGTNIGTGTFTMIGNGLTATWELTGSPIANNITFADGSTGNKTITLASGTTDAELSGTITFADDSGDVGTSRISPPAGGTIIISGKMTGGGTGGFAKRNPGTVVITNNTNDYTGPTTIVDAGTLLVDGTVPGNVYFGQNLDGSGGTAGFAGTLGGSGLIGGNVLVRGVSNLAPGGTSSAGVTTPTADTLTINGELDISLLAANTGLIAIDLDTPSTSDKVVAGTVKIGTGALGLGDFAFNNLGGLAAGTYTLISSGGLTGSINPANATGTVSGLDVTLSVSGNHVLLTVTSADPYTTWTDTFPSLTNTDFAFDFDNDGISTGLEWVLGGNPTVNDAASIMPNVAGSAASGLTLTFDREEDTIGVVTLVVEYGTTLAGFPNSVAIGASGTGPDGNGVTVNVNDVPDPDSVTVNIPASNAAPDGRVFARLKATMP